jgi:hypothetical protein
LSLSTVGTGTPFAHEVFGGRLVQSAEPGWGSDPSICHFTQVMAPPPLGGAAGGVLCEGMQPPWPELVHAGMSSNGLPQPP